MSIFEAWSKRTYRKCQQWGTPLEIEEVIEAGSQALKEMMVGEPIAMHLELFHRSEREIYTLLYDENNELHARWIGKHGADGEEVVVLVTRL